MTQENDFKQATKWLKEGKKVRGVTWSEGVYIYMKNKLQIVDNKDVVVALNMPFLEQCWDIYKEDTWNLYDDYNDDTECGYMNWDIEMLKEKILEDIMKSSQQDYLSKEVFKDILDKRFGF